ASSVSKSKLNSSSSDTAPTSVTGVPTADSSTSGATITSSPRSRDNSSVSSDSVDEVNSNSASDVSSSSRVKVSSTDAGSSSKERSYRVSDFPRSDPLANISSVSKEDGSS